MTFAADVSAELTHLKALFVKDATKLAMFFSPILSDIETIVKNDASGDLEVGLAAAATAFVAGATPEAAAAAAGVAALGAVKAVVEKQALSVGETAINLTAQALTSAAQASTAAAQ